MFQQLLSSDPEFKAKVDRVQQANPNMSDFERMKFPSAMLDIHLGNPVRKTMDTTSTMLNTATQKTGAFDQLTHDPLVFAGQTLKNIPASTSRLVGGVVSAVAHPLQTGKSLFQLGVGGAANTLESIASLAGVQNPEDIFQLDSEEVASAVGDFYVQRYGSLDAAAATLRDDPAGFLSDLGAVVTGVGGAIKGGASLAGSVTGAATKTATELSALGKGLRTAQAVGGATMKVGVNMEPIVILGRGAVMAGRGIKNATIAGVKGIAPNAMATKGLKINPSDIRAFQNLPGNELPGDFLLRKGILSGGDIAVTDDGLKMTGMSPLGRTRTGIMTDLEKIATKAKATVDKSLASVRQTYDVLDNVPPEVPKLMDEILSLAEKYDLPEPRAFIQNLLSKERVSLSELNELKRVAYDFFNTYKKSNLADDSFRAKQIINYERSLRAFIEQQAEIKGLPDIAILNQDTQKAREILEAMASADAANLSKGKLSLGLMDGMFGIGAYGITGDFMSAAGIVMARKMIESTVFKTTFAKYVNRLDPRQIGILKKAFETMKHTKESKQILRKVVAQTADDIKNERIADMENVTPPRSQLQGQSVMPQQSESMAQRTSDMGVMDNVNPSIPPESPLGKSRPGNVAIPMRKFDFSKIPDAGNAKAVLDYSAKALNTTPKELASIVKAAGNDVAAIEQALMQKFGQTVMEYMAAAEQSGNLGAVDFFDPIRRAIFKK